MIYLNIFKQILIKFFYLLIELNSIENYQKKVSKINNNNNFISYKLLINHFKKFERTKIWETNKFRRSVNITYWAKNKPFYMYLTSFFSFYIVKSNFFFIFLFVELCDRYNLFILSRQKLAEKKFFLNNLKKKKIKLHATSILNSKLTFYFLNWNSFVNNSYIFYTKKIFNFFSINFKSINLLNLLNFFSFKKINLNFIRKHKIFNKGRYSRNRQYYRTGVYWCLYINIIAVLGFYFWFYKVTLNFGYFWWLLWLFIFSFFFSKYFNLFSNNYNFIFNILNDFWWLLNIIIFYFSFIKNNIFKNILILNTNTNFFFNLFIK